jgi:hypothetical protein
LATFCWTKSLLCNVATFTGMLLYPESTLQLCSSRRFCEVFTDLFRFPVSRPDNVVFRLDAHQSATSVWTTRSFCPDAHQCLEASNSSRFHPSGRNGKSSGRSSEFEKTQCSSASVRTTWLYRPDAIQCLTSIRVSDSRHSYRKTAATVRTMCDPVRTMFSIRQDMHTKFNRLDGSLHGPDDQASYMEIACTSSTVRTSAFKVRTLKPYYGNFVQTKCNRPDARATPSGCGLVMEAFSATLERPLQFIVWTLNQAVQTPSGILIITFYSNIGLGQNRRRWKADKKCCQQIVQMATRSVRKDPVLMERFARPDGPAENFRILFGQEKLGPSGRPKAPVWMCVPQTPFWTQNRVS